VKLQVERDHLAEAVAWTARALPARPTAPVLAGMRLHAGTELTLSTFDYEVSAQATVPVITDEEGTVLVSGRLLAEIVRSLPTRPVDLVTDGTNLEGARLEISEPPARCRCRDCAAEFEPDGPIALCSCGSADIAILAGSELRIMSVEVA